MRIPSIPNRRARRYEALARYRAALIASASPAELDILAAALDPGPAEIVARVHAAGASAGPRPDPSFVNRLEANLMHTFATSVHGTTIPLQPALSIPTNGRSASFPLPALRPARRPWPIGQIATAALVVLTLLGTYAVFQSAAPGVQDQTSAFADIALYKGNPARTGENPGPGPTVKPVELWRLETRGDVQSSPAIVAGVLYVGSGDGTVYALDPATRAERWTFATGGPVLAHPAVADGIVYIGSEDRTLYALEAATGAELWRLPDLGENVGPLAADGTLYAGTEGGLLALDPATGAERWRFTDGGSILRSIAFADGLVYAGSTDGKLNALDPADGSVVWQFQTEGGVMGTPTIAGGIVYQAAFDGPADQLYALDAATGTELWRFAVGAAVLSPTVGGGMLYLPTTDRALYALDAASGTLRWRFASDRHITAAPALVSDTLYVAGEDGNLYALDATSGSERWRVPAGEAKVAPVVSGGVVFVATVGGALVALGDPSSQSGGAMTAPGGTDTATPSAGSTGAPVEYVGQITGGTHPMAEPHDLALDSAGNLYVVDLGLDRVVVYGPDGAMVRSWGSNGRGDGQFLDPSGIVLDVGGNVYVSDWSRHDIQKFAPDGTFLLRWGGQGVNDGQLNAPQVSAVDHQGRVWAVTGNSRNQVQVFDSEGVFLFGFGSTGRGDGQLSSPNALALDSNGNVYVAECGNPRVSKFAPDGTFLTSWNHDFRCLAGIEIDEQDRVYVADADNSRIQVFDTEGAILTMWGTRGLEEGQVEAPLGLAFDGAGLVYVVDIAAARVSIFRLLPPLAPDATPAA